jgi:hypothetical protein
MQIFRMREFFGTHRCDASHTPPTKIWALAPGLFFGPEFSPDKYFGQDTP